MSPRMMPEEALVALATMADEDFPTVRPDLELSENDRAELIDAGRRASGRPSLTAPGERSPQITLRLPQSLRQRLKARAEADSETESEITRKALELYLGPAA